MKLTGKVGFQLSIVAILFSCCCISVFAQAGDIAPGTSVFVFKKPKKFFSQNASVSTAGKKTATAQTNSKPKSAAGKTTRAVKKTSNVGKISAADEPIAPEDWINEQADTAIEERKVSDSEPFLSLSDGFLNSRYTFCESPQFPEAAKRAKQKTVNQRVLITVGKYGGVLDAKSLEGDASFRANVYNTLGSMMFRQSYFMGQPVRIEGLAAFSQNPANSLLCRDTDQQVEIPAIIDGGELNEYLKSCEAPQLPAGQSSAEARIQVIVDEQGKVVQAKPIGGNAAFGEIAAQSAMKATFPRSLITGKGVKVRGELFFTQNSSNSVPCSGTAGK